MSIPLTNPTVIDQQPINLNSFWLSNLQITAPNPNVGSTLLATVEKVQANEDGSFLRAPYTYTGAKGTLRINNLEDTIVTDAETLTFKSPVTGQDITMYTAEIMLAVTLKVKQMAEKAGVI